MLLETELRMAVALAIPCLVRLTGLEVGGRGEPTGDREDWLTTLLAFSVEVEGLPEASPVSWRYEM